MSYLLRCNSNVTSLLSGTQVKAVIAYVMNYITKSLLKIYSIFETIKTVLNKHLTTEYECNLSAETVKRLITKIVNSLTSQIEIG